jgi:hypothetical protein
LSSGGDAQLFECVHTHHSASSTLSAAVPGSGKTGRRMRNLSSSVCAGNCAAQLLYAGATNRYCELRDDRGGDVGFCCDRRLRSSGVDVEFRSREFTCSGRPAELPSFRVQPSVNRAIGARADRGGAAHGGRSFGRFAHGWRRERAGRLWRWHRFGRTSAHRDLDSTGSDGRRILS